LAYGALNLKPLEFERLQPHEFMALLEGYIWRKERQEELFAYFTCNIMNTALVKPISPTDLLNPIRENPEEKRKSDEEYLREQFKAVLAEK
jgi:hypothetical protein